MKRILIIAALLAINIGVYAQIFKSKADSCSASFFSEATIENIEAKNKLATSILNVGTSDIVFQIPNLSFKFEKPLMEEHFNENYMESDKYPKSTFKGKINEKIDYTKDGEYKVTTTGMLNIHGVEKERTIEGTIVIRNGEIKILSEFMVHVADHKIEIPQVVMQKIAEDIKVNVECIYEPYKR